MKVEILRGKKLGLGIRDIQNRVLVSKVDPNTLAHGKLQVRDHIIDIDGTRVSDKEIARELIIKSMRAQGYFTCIVGRPVTEEAKKACDLDLSVRSEPPSIRMNDDVREIAAREQAEIRAKNDQVYFDIKNVFFYILYIFEAILLKNQKIKPNNS